MKTVLQLFIYTKRGTQIKQLLMLSEARLITHIAKENESVYVKAIEITKERYKIEFGK